MTNFSFASEASNFDNHISKSIPGFDNLNYMIIQLSDYFILSRNSGYTTVVDLGCSTGRLLEDLQKSNSSKKRVIWKGYEIEEEMILKCNNKYPLEFFKKDITDKDFILDDTVPTVSFCTSIFTLQFLHFDQRLPLLKKVYDSLIPGGALIVSEKLLSPSAILQNCISFPFYDFKLQSFTEKEILDKERSLRSMMKCKPEKDLLIEFQEAGFSEDKIQCFWRNYNFAAYVLIK